MSPTSPLVLAAIVALLAACAPPAPPPQPAAQVDTSPQLATEQKLVVGQPMLVASMDPHATLGNNGRRYGLFESIVSQKADGTVGPGLASEWKNLDASRWQFTIVTNRTFHDGGR